MDYLTVFLSVVLVLSVAGVSSADRYFSVKSGKMEVKYNCGAEGLSVNYNGVGIIRDSSLWVHNPAWTYHYYGLPQLEDPVQVRDIDGGKEAVVTHNSEWFHGVQRITVKENSVAVEFTYGLVKQADDADMEYCYGKVCADPILGRSFKATTASGATKEGVIPIMATTSDYDKILLAGDQLRKLEIDSRVGKMTFTVSGDPNAASFLDYRKNEFEQRDKAPIFWVGDGVHLEYGKQYTSTITLTINPVIEKPKEVIQGGSKDGVVEERKDLREPSVESVYVIPEPQDMKLTSNDFILNENTRIVVSDTAASEDYRGAESFAEEVKILYGFEPKIVREKEVTGDEPVILVGEAAMNKKLASATAEEKLTAPDKDEGYALISTPKHVLVLGHDKRGTYYGMQTLKQLLKANPEQVTIQGCLINDWPSLKFRGVHLFTGNQALPFHKKLIDRIFSRFKMNAIVLEVDQIKWKSDPSIAVGFSEDQEDVKKEIDYAKQHFIEVSPLLQSLGHCDWMFANGKNRDLAENPNNPYSYCPSNPRIYDYVFQFYDETVKLFDNPRFIHIGHDEVTEPGGFPLHEECKKRSAEQIFVDDTLKIRDHLAKSGARIMMWGDMMLAKGDSPDATNAKSPEMAKWIQDKIPKDVVITDWHYAPGKPDSFKSIGIFTKEGHDTIASTWYTPKNIEYFSQQAKNVGAYGLLQTTWAGFNSNEDNLKWSFEQFATMILAAEYAWNNGKTTLEHLPYKWDEEFREQWNPKPVDRKAETGFVVDISSAYNVNLADNGWKTGWLGLGSHHDLSNALTGDVRFKGDLFRMAADNKMPSAIRLASSMDTDRAYPNRVEIIINRTAKSLLFLQTCAWYDNTGHKIGSYKINYGDGTSEESSLIYGSNAASWMDQRSLKDAVRVWEDYTKDKEDVSLRKFQWDNPHPEKTIKSIELISDNTAAGPVVLAISGIE